MRNSEDTSFTTHQRQSSRIEEHKLNDLDYAYIAFLESEREQAQQQLLKTNQIASQVGLEIIYGPHLPLQLNGEQINIVRDFKYLGILVVNSINDVIARKAQPGVLSGK